MSQFKPDEHVMKINEPMKLMSHEKAYVKLDAGCVWTFLFLDERKAGIAYWGPSTFAVDAITDTEQGAIGTSVSGELKGVQFYLGESDIESISSATSIDDIRQVGFDNQKAFIRKINDRIDKIKHRSTQINISEHEGHILLGTDSEEKPLVLVIKEDSLVFTHDKTTYVTGDNGSVSVDKSGVYIGGSNGKSMSITKHGISGLEGLRELRALKDIGPSISRAVAESMKHIKSAKRSYKGFKHSHVWDDVDSFDWDDDE
jgi:hypothetical protein